MQIHMLVMYPRLVYDMFASLCTELFGIDRFSPKFNDLLAGADNKLIETDRELFRLSKKAIELGFQPIFEATPNDKELLSKIEEEKGGGEWVKELRTFLDEYGWRTTGSWTVASPSWVEDPSLTLPSIRQYMGQETFKVDEARKQLIEKRENAEKELLPRVPKDKKEYFTKLLRSSQWVPIVEEEHVFYCENYQNAILRQIVKEMGLRMARKGSIEDPFDIQYLLPEEIEWRFISGTSAKKLVDSRKKMVAEWKRPDPEFCIGNPEKIMDVLMANPMLRMDVGPFPVVRPELGADLYATASSPGVVEGEVCVVIDESDFEKFKQDSILVAPITSPSWTPLFNMAKAVITDGGGMLSHAQVVGREHGIPVIAGAKDATAKLKDGMKVRVDGDHGAVYIID